MIKIERVKVFLQEMGGSCGPAAIKALLYYYGIKKTEKELIRLCKTSKIRGTHPKMMEQALNTLGFKTRSGELGTWKTLNYWVNKQGIPVLVNWFRYAPTPPDGHYSLIIKLNKRYIWLADAEVGDIELFEWPEFFHVWFDFNGEPIMHTKPKNTSHLDYVNDRDNFVIRWWLAAIPKKRFFKSAAALKKLHKK